MDEKQPGLRRMVIDIELGHQNLMPRLALSLANLKETDVLYGVDGVNITVIEVDLRSVKAKLTIEGMSIDPDTVINFINNYVDDKIEFEFGKSPGSSDSDLNDRRRRVSINSLDQIIAGKRIVEEVPTYMDRR